MPSSMPSWVASRRAASPTGACPTVRWTCRSMRTRAAASCTGTSRRGTCGRSSPSAMTARPEADSRVADAIAPAPRDPRARMLVIASVVLLGLLAWSGIRPYDRTTWWLVVAPVLIALPILWATYRRLPLTTLVYVCIFLHAIVLMVGGAYTYARVPVGFQVAELFGL